MVLGRRWETRGWKSQHRESGGDSDRDDATPHFRAPRSRMGEGEGETSINSGGGGDMRAQSALQLSLSLHDPADSLCLTPTATQFPPCAPLC